MYEWIKERQKKWDTKYFRLKGKMFTDSIGRVWKFTGNNDIGVPYFKQFKNGKLDKRESVLTELDKEFILKQLELKERRK